ncbi:MAG: DNA adenine methylase [Spirochaetaceae bacterium]
MEHTLHGKQTLSTVDANLIPYIGNKRRLLPALDSLFSRYEAHDRPTVFADPFAGSGAVSRLARYRGYRIYASDIEPYAAVLTRAAVAFSPEEADAICSDLGGMKNAIRHLNNVGDSARHDANRRGYIAYHYAPERTDSPRIGRERLFYTAENARFIDAVRDEIARIAGGAPASRASDLEVLLLAPLLLEAAVHVNTSGVFKAYHRGYGGHGKDALKRIMSPMRLEEPTLFPGPPAVVRCCDAESLFAGSDARALSCDIVYLDPPYNSHQYGSNYFMLNTITRWDKPEVDESRSSEGTLVSKAGIRPDWKDTRSDFCSRRTAVSALRRLLLSVESSVIALSYNTEGLIPFDVLCELMREHGRLAVETQLYTQYRGGRQSAGRRNHTTEILLVSHAEARLFPGTGGPAVEIDDKAGGAKLVQCAMQVRAFSRGRFVPERVRAVFGSRDACVESGQGTFRFRGGYTIDEMPDLKDLLSLPVKELEYLRDRIASCQCVDNAEELSVVLQFIDGNAEVAGFRPIELEKRFLMLLRKLAHPRYIHIYERFLRAFVGKADRAMRHERVLAKLEAMVSGRLGDTARRAVSHEPTD